MDYRLLFFSVFKSEIHFKRKGKNNPYCENNPKHLIFLIKNFQDYNIFLGGWEKNM
jgi:hypothetical protein